MRCKHSCQYFLTRYGFIQDPSTFSEFKFGLWEFQSELIDMFNESRATIILKARQLGISWLVAGYALWTAIFNDNANVLLLSKREDEAQKLLDKVKFIYDRLPQWLKAPEFSRSNSQITFSATVGDTITKGSRITALPATEDAGRSETGSLIIADEWAFHPYAETNYAAFRPAMSAGNAKFIGVSTANGIGTFFHEIWLGAKRGTNGFAHRFIPWFAHPNRDDQWYKYEKAAFPSAMQEFYQEFPATEEEAFIAAGGCVFDSDVLNDMMEETVCDPLSLEMVGDHRLRQYVKDGWLAVFENPSPSQQYDAGMDPAEGIEKKDFTAIEFINHNTHKQVARFKARVDIDIAARACYDICMAYNAAFLAVERNNHGHTVLYILDQLGYNGKHCLYYSAPPAKGKDGKAGFTTGQVTKKRLVDLLISGIRSRDIQISDREWIEQAKGFVRHKDGSVGSIGTAYDDNVIAMGLAWMGSFERPALRHFRRQSTRQPAFRRG